MFITESIRMFAPSAALLMSSASRSSGVVGAWTTSKPASRASFMRSAWLSLPGNMSKTRPFLIGKGAGSGDVGKLLGTGEDAKSSAPAYTLSPVEQIAVPVDFRNSRRDGLLIDPSPAGAQSAQFV